MEDVYSSFKVIAHEEKVKQLKEGEIITPVMVQWDISNRCNLQCNFCFYLINPLSDWDKNAIMPTELCFRVLDELKDLGVKAIEWTGGGSVECHPDYKRILLESKELGFENALVTNGTLLDNDALDIIKDFEWIRFSVDAAYRKTYKRIKDSCGFTDVISNIKKLINIKEKSNVVGFSFIVCRENYKEIVNAAKLAKNLGCDNIRFSLAMTPEGDSIFRGIWDDCVKQLREAKKLEDYNFKVFEFSNRIFELEGSAHSPCCYYTDFVGVISPSGVYPCCRLKDDEKFNLGKLEEESFRDIWFGEKRNQFLDKIRNGCFYDCWMTEKNKIITALVQPPKEHINFI